MDCVGFDEVTIPGTIITSPNYPGNYSNNMECQMKIRFPADQIVTITVDEFDVEHDSSCEDDLLFLFDGEPSFDGVYDLYKDEDLVMGSIELCGKYAERQYRGKTIKSTGNVMGLRYLSTSDNLETRPGFKIHTNNGMLNFRIFWLLDNNHIFQITPVG